MRDVVYGGARNGGMSHGSVARLWSFRLGYKELRFKSRPPTIAHLITPIKRYSGYNSLRTPPFRFKQ